MTPDSSRKANGEPRSEWGWPRISQRALQERALTIALTLLVLGGLAAYIYATRWGIGLSPDSATYIAGASGIAHGKGYSFPIGGGEWRPTTLWPPLYSMVMAIPIALGADPLVSARWLNGALLGGNLILVVALLARVANLPLAVPIVGGAFFLLNPDTFFTHGWAWSEALFIFVGFAGLLFLDRYLSFGSLKDLTISAVFTGLALITRYSGVAFVIVGALAVVAIPRHQANGRSKARDVLWFGGLASLPFGLWSIRNALVAGTVTGAGFTSQPVHPDEWQGAYDILYLWFMPGRVGEPSRTYVMALVGAALIGLAILIFKTTFRPKGGVDGNSVRLGSLTASFIIIYSLVLVGSRLFVRKFPLDDPRQLLPLYLAAILTFAAGGWLLRRQLATEGSPARLRGAARWLGQSAALGTAGYLALMLATHSVHAYQWVLRSQLLGMGYSNDSWRSSHLVEVVRSLPNEIPVYSNGYDALYLLTGKETYPLPGTPSGAAPFRIEELSPEWQEMASNLRERAGVIAYFDNPTRRGMVDEQSLTGALSLCAISKSDEGTLYGLCE